MNKYICVRELIFRLFRDMNLGRLCSNSLQARQKPPGTSPQHPGVLRLHVNTFIFRPRLGGLPTWGPPTTMQTGPNSRKKRS